MGQRTWSIAGCGVLILSGRIRSAIPSPRLSSLSVCLSFPFPDLYIVTIIPSYTDFHSISDHFSLEAKSRKSSTLKNAARYLKNPGLISLGGGLPSPEYFPIEHLDIKVPTAPGFSPEATRESGTVLRAGKHDIQEGTSTYDLEIALNYGQAVGAAPLLRFVTEHTEPSLL
ncbi:hypothetical protein VN97_g6361 [Penicillium thymicola]|uniref:Uncharacterized protein n=1 Tax=Penicillium thymicola TaxID=293382 RepID=A0AAI9X7J8_PENTH|nr:hypothetical protein VN97_g6361 [Penicillium thymicola]